MLLDLLLNAVRRGDVHQLVGLLDLDEQDSDGSTTMMKAATLGHIEIVELLALNGAKVNMTDKYYNTSLSNAALNGKKEVVKFLLKNNAVISPYKREDLMSMLAFRGYSDILFTILDNIEMLSSRHIIFNTLCWWNKGLMLVSAARGGHIGLVNALLERGIRLNDALKKEALDGVCLLTNGSAGVVRLLVENTVDEAVVGRESVFRRLQLLLRVSSRMRAVDLVVPLVNACSVGNLEVITYLLSRGADINGTNSSGDTGLMLASRHCNVGVVSLLLGMGADLHIVGRNGVTAFFYALMGVDGNAGQAAIGIAVELAERGAEIFQTSNWQHHHANGLELGIIGLEKTNQLLAANKRYRLWSRRRRLLMFLYSSSYTQPMGCERPLPKALDLKSPKSRVLFNTDLTKLLCQYL